jgi:hypothetical protein
MSDTAPAVTAVKPGRHGTYGRYHYGPDASGNPGRCSCAPCLAASARHNSALKDRRRQLAYGRWQPFTDAAPVRDHVRKLSEYGIGLRAVASAAGVPRDTLVRLMYGHGDAPPSRQVRPETARRILEVRPSPDLLAPGTRVDATGTHRRLRALVAKDHALAVLAGQLGVTPPNLGTLLRSARVTASTARAVKALYDELWDAAPDESTPRGARMAASARRMAAARGWPPPMAWDDDTIDDPAASPAQGWRRGLQGTSAGLAEDAAELLARGLDRNQVAERLGRKRDAVDTALARTARRTEALEAAPADITEEQSHAAA